MDIYSATLLTYLAFMAWLVRKTPLRLEGALVLLAALGASLILQHAFGSFALAFVDLVLCGWFTWMIAETRHRPMWWAYACVLLHAAMIGVYAASYYAGLSSSVHMWAINALVYISATCVGADAIREGLSHAYRLTSVRVPGWRTEHRLHSHDHHKSPHP